MLFIFGISLLVVACASVVVAIAKNEDGMFVVAVIAGAAGALMLVAHDSGDDSSRNQATTARLVKQVVAAERTIESERGQFATTRTDFDALAPKVARTVDRAGADIEFIPGQLSGAVRVTVSIYRESSTALLRPRTRKPKPQATPDSGNRGGPYGNGTLSPSTP